MIPTSANFSIFCTGSSGLVASHLKHTAKSHHIPFFGLDLHGEERSTNILKPQELKAHIHQDHATIDPQANPPILFHFAALTLTALTLSPKDEQLTKDLNIQGTQNVLDVAHQLNIPVVHISTDFVYSGGRKRTPYIPTDPLAPDASPYARSKAEAERLVHAAASRQQVTVVRIAYPYGNSSHPKAGLLRKMLSWMDHQDTVSLYSDQHTCPTPITYITQAALKLSQLITQKDIISGVTLHVVGQPTTPYNFGLQAKKIFHKKTTLTKSSIKGHGPTNLQLDSTETGKILDLKAPSHQQALKDIAHNHT